MYSDSAYLQAGQLLKCYRRRRVPALEAVSNDLLHFLAFVAYITVLTLAPFYGWWYVGSQELAVSLASQVTCYVIATAGVPDDVSRLILACICYH